MNPVRLAPVLLVSTILAAPALAQQRGIDTTFERIDTVGKHILLFTGDGRSYRMTKKTQLKHRRLWVFLKKGSKIHLTVQRRWVMKVQRGWKTKSTAASRVIVEVRKANEGDRVIIDGAEYLFIKADDKHVRVSPKGGSGYSGEESLRIDRIKSFKIAPKEETGPTAQDTLQIFGVQKGDTVRLTVGRKDYTGGVYELNDKVVMLLELTRGRWAKRPRRFLRGEVSKVRHLALSWTRAYELPQKGSITIKTQIFRRGAEGRPLEVKAELSHDRQGALLSGLLLRINLSERVGGAQVADAEQVVQIPPLFPGDVHKVSKEAIHRRYVDAQPVPKPGSYKLLPYSDKDAKPYIVRTIDLGGMAPEMLERLYLGGGQSHDGDFLRYLMNVLIFPTSKAGLRPDKHAEIARKGLQAAKIAAAKALVEEITVADGDMKLTSIRKGRLLREELPEGMEPDTIRKKLIAELARVPEGLAGEQGAKLFEYYASHPGLREPIEAAFTKQSKSAMPQLFAVAIPAGKASDPKRVKAAQELIRSLGPESIPHLERELKKRGVKLDRLIKAQSQHGSSNPSKVLSVALDLAKEWQKGKQASFRDQEVAAALKQAEAGEADKALLKVRKILEEDKRHAKAKKALPKLLLMRASSLAKAGATGEAAVLYEEAHDLSDRAGAPLAKLMVAGLKEDLTGIVMRASPHAAGAVIGKVKKGLLLEGNQRKDGWVEVQSPKGTAYVRSTCIQKKAATKFMSVEDLPPSALFEAQVKAIKALDPSQGAAADEVLGTYYAIIAEQRFKEGKYDEVGPLLERTAELAPNDPRLGLATQAWLRSNVLLLLGLLLVVVLGAVASVIVYKKLQKEKEKEAAQDDAALRITLFTDEMDAGVTAEDDLAQGGPAPIDLGIPDGEA